MSETIDPRAYFDGLWAKGDPWDLDTSMYDQGKYRRELSLLAGRRFPRALEIGCAAGSFTRRLVAVADQVVALDVSAEAIARARAATSNDRIDYRVADIVTFDPAADGPWDLIVLSETIYYIGWRHSFFDVAWMAHELFGSMNDGGQLLMTNTVGLPGHHLQLRPLIETYRDLFLNTGLRLASSEWYNGVKADAPMDALICVFEKRS